MDTRTRTIHIITALHAAARRGDLIECDERALQAAAHLGDLDACKSIHAAWPVAGRAARNYVPSLCCAAEQNHLHVCKWLHKTVEITASSATIALQAAASAGHLEMCKWLHKTFCLLAGDARSLRNLALHYAILYNHEAVCEWLVATYALTLADLDEVEAATSATPLSNTLRLMVGRRELSALLETALNTSATPVSSAHAAELLAQVAELLAQVGEWLAHSNE